MSSVNLNLLPAISFAPLDTAEIESSIFTVYERLSGITLQPGDPVRLFLESLAYIINVQNGLIDLAGKQNLLAYASGANLDHLGALMGVARIPAMPASCLLRFGIDSPLAFAVPIPKGTRAGTMDGRTAFATAGNAEIAPGRLYVDVTGICTEAGAAGSGLVAGQISRLVDPLPYVTSVANVTVTGEGMDIEDDERLRERIRIAPESYTVAGSSGAYEARVLEVSAAINAVSVTTPEPGVVDVRFVLENGDLPDAATISLVREHLDAETVRPLTDKVLVGAPDVVEYSLSGRWYLKRANANLLSGITAEVGKALEAYRLWQRGMPGRDINPSRLISLVEQAGAKRVELDYPAFTKLEPIQIAREKNWNFVFAGVEDE